MTTPVEIAIQRHLSTLSVEIGARPTGSEANRRAEDYIAGAMAAAGCMVERQPFTCLDWAPHGVELRLGGEALAAAINPFSPSCHVIAPMVIAGNLAELEAADLTGKIAILHGELTVEPLFPKHFPFFTVADHVRIAETLERGQPAAVIAVSPQEANPAPIFEDGDFALPSVTVPAPVGRKLLARPGAEARLSIRSEVRPAAGANVVGRKAGAGKRRALVCAHFDTKPETPGALDNAAGVAAMLALAETLPAHDLSLEFVAFDGEDDYAAPGQVAYLRLAGDSLAAIDLVVNIDGAGLVGANNTVALFDPPPDLARRIRQVIARHPYIAEAAPWPQGDHSIFWQRGVPAVAITTAAAWEVVGALIHTEQDALDRVSASSLAEVVAFVADLLDRRGRS